MIELQNLEKIFETPQGKIKVVDNVNLTINQGEVCVLLGPSGCGKTTTLKMINRLIPKSGGKIIIDGEDTDLLDVVTLRRRIGYVIQQIGLFPNMTIEDNVCSVPDLLGWDKMQSRKRAAELLALVNLDPDTFIKRYPKELSGGQQQRAGVARALAAKPKLMLMDEPFGAIDPINRLVIQDEFMKIQRKLGITVIFVSHDLEEATKMADRIAILNEGKLVQEDSPDKLLSTPKNDFIVDFLGGERTLKRLGLFKISEVMQKTKGTASERALDINQSLRQAVSSMFYHNCIELDVTDAGKMVGKITQDQIRDFLAVREHHHQKTALEEINQAALS